MPYKKRIDRNSRPHINLVLAPKIAKFLSTGMKPNYIAKLLGTTPRMVEEFITANSKHLESLIIVERLQSSKQDSILASQSNSSVIVAQQSSFDRDLEVEE
jgi:predicted transcriptional regulator